MRKKGTDELNKREKAILKFIEKQLKDKGYPPSVREIGKAVGFAPLVCLFVGYLVIPLVFIGMTSMSTSMSGMSAVK
mgnify:CR=1 FL=1